MSEQQPHGSELAAGPSASTGRLTTVLMTLAAAALGMLAGAVVLWSLVRPTPDPVVADEPPAVQGAPWGKPDNSASDSRLYSVTLAANTDADVCPGLEVRRPRVPDAELQPYLQQIADCMTDLNREALLVQGIELTSPTVRTFRGEITTACGPWGNYGFYCPEDRTIYVDEASDDEAGSYGSMALGYFTLMSHEYAHHLQLHSGITVDYAKQLAQASDESERLELSRRSELQAACMGGVFFAAMDKRLGAGPGHEQAMLAFFEGHNDQVSGEATHGSGRAMKSWYLAGHNGLPIGYGHCNTWGATPDQIR